ncbi:hypothetical protein D3C84_1102740 [compost metagenome]
MDLAEMHWGGQRLVGRPDGHADLASQPVEEGLDPLGRIRAQQLDRIAGHCTQRCQNRAWLTTLHGLEVIAADPADQH